MYLLVNIKWNREKTKRMGIFVLFAVSSIKINHTDQRESDQTVKNEQDPCLALFILTGFSD